MSDKDLTQPPAGEFIMFASGDGRVRVECRFESDTIWLSQAAMAELYDKDVRTLNEHLINIFSEGELVQNLQPYHNAPYDPPEIPDSSPGRKTSGFQRDRPLQPRSHSRCRLSRSLASRHAIPPVGHPDASGIPDQRFCDGR